MRSSSKLQSCELDEKYLICLNSVTWAWRPSPLECFYKIAGFTLKFILTGYALETKYSRINGELMFFMLIEQYHLSYRLANVNQKMAQTQYDAWLDDREPTF